MPRQNFPGLLNVSKIDAGGLGFVLTTTARRGFHATVSIDASHIGVQPRSLNPVK